jgi:hypothetical protein
MELGAGTFILLCSKRRTQQMRGRLIAAMYIPTWIAQRYEYKTKKKRSVSNGTTARAFCNAD